MPFSLFWYTDCDADDECQGDLECFQRPQDDVSPVPGCVGEGMAGRDYCYRAEANSLRPRLPECSVDSPCDICQGDCDNDDECAAGLSCSIRGAGELTPVFGCSGLGIAGLDYCYNASAVNSVVGETLGIDSDEPEELDTSDREDETADTTTALVELDDSEEESDVVELVIRDSKCSKRSPCAKCEGECKNDYECESRLSCMRREGLAVIPGCGNGFSGVSFCYDPDDAPLRRQLLRH